MARSNAGLFIMKESLTYYLDMVDKVSGPAKKIENSLLGIDEQMSDLNSKRGKAAAIKTDIETYNKLNDRLSESSKKLDDARRNTSLLGAEIAKSDNPTKKQIAAFERSKKAVEAQTKTVNKYQSNLSDMSAQLREAGVNTGKLSIEQRRAEVLLKSLDRQIVNHSRNLEIESNKKKQIAEQEQLLNARKLRAQDYLQQRELRNVKRQNRLIEGEAIKHQFELERVNRRKIASDAKVFKHQQKLNKLKNYGNQIKGSLPVAAGLVGGAVGVMAGGAGFAQMVAAEQAEARGYGMSYEEYRQNEYIGSQAGIGSDSIADLQEEFKNKLGELYQSGEQKNLQEFAHAVGGFDFKALKGKSSTEQFNAIIAKIETIKDADQRQYFMDDLFGGEGAKLAQVLEDSGKSYKQLTSEANKYNLVTEAGEKGLAAYALSTQRFGYVTKGAFTEFFGLVGEQLTPYLNEWSTSISIYFRQNETSIKQFAYEVGVGIKTFITFMREHGSTMASVAKWVAIGVTVATGLKVAIGVFGAFTAAISAARIAFAGLSLVMAANPIGLIVTGIGLAVAAGVSLYKNWDTVKEKLGAAWDWLSAKFSAVFDPIIKKFNWIGEQYANIKNMAGDALDSASDFIFGDDKASVTATVKPTHLSAVASPVSYGASQQVTNQNQITVHASPGMDEKKVAIEVIKQMDRRDREKQRGLNAKLSD